ncbi:MAG: AraC family transcriptional regulator [Clostridia bacterium]
MDLLSDVLASLRLDGAMYVNAEFTAPWCIRGECGLASVQERLAGAEHVAFFHYLVEGTCNLRLAGGGETISAKAGDLVLFPSEGRHLMGSDLHLVPMEGDAELTREGDLYWMRHGGGGAMTRFACGYVACSRTVYRLLLQALPPIVRIPLGTGSASPLVSELLRTALRESAAGGPGARSVLARLAELLFMEAVRRYAESAGTPPQGWLAGARDPHVGRALAALHAEPGRPWTVDELASASLLSRSALAARFSALVGESPMQYLTRWRLALAADALRSSGEAIARVAERAGYESEAAFNRAFKREYGRPPAAWRRAAA